jgi:hypothetical protein
MQRVSALWQASPRKVVAALCVLMLAAMMAVASGASFTSTSANAGNVVATGVMTHTNSKPGAILTIDNLMPGHSDHGTVTLTNTGDADGLFTLSKSNVVNSDGTHPLSAKLDLVVTDTTTGDTVYTGKVGNMPASPAGTIAPGASHTYDFVVTFPDGGKPASATSGDNVFQDASVTVDYAWESVSN